VQEVATVAVLIGDADAFPCNCFHQRRQLGYRAAQSDSEATYQGEGIWDEAGLRGVDVQHACKV
jgi:hypothetical protein